MKLTQNAIHIEVVDDEDGIEQQQQYDTLQEVGAAVRDNSIRISVFTSYCL